MAKKILTKKDILDWAEQYKANYYSNKVQVVGNQSDNYCPPHLKVGGGLVLKPEVTEYGQLLSRVYCNAKITGINGEDLETPIDVPNDEIGRYQIHGSTPIKSISINGAPYMLAQQNQICDCASNVKVKDTLGADTLVCEQVFKPTASNQYYFGRITEGPIYDQLHGVAALRISVILTKNSETKVISSDYIYFKRDQNATEEMPNSTFVLQYKQSPGNEPPLLKVTETNGVKTVEFDGDPFVEEVVWEGTTRPSTNADLAQQNAYAKYNGNQFKKGILVQRTEPPTLTYPYTYQVKGEPFFVDNDDLWVSLYFRTERLDQTVTYNKQTYHRYMDSIYASVLPKNNYTVKAVIVENYGRLCLLNSKANVLYITSGHLSNPAELPSMYFADFERVYIGGDRKDWEFATNNGSQEVARRLPKDSKIFFEYPEDSYVNHKNLEHGTEALGMFYLSRTGEHLAAVKYGNPDSETDKKLFPMYLTGSVRDYLLSSGTSVQDLIDFTF